jgi:hypothetical protein
LKLYGFTSDFKGTDFLVLFLPGSHSLALKLKSH